MIMSKRPCATSAGVIHAPGFILKACLPRPLGRGVGAGSVMQQRLRVVLLLIFAPCCAGLLVPAPRAAVRLRARSPEEPPEEAAPEEEGSLRDAWERGVANGREIAARFANPRVDDQGLVYADALVAGVVAPGLEVIVAAALGAPLPLWAYAWGPRRLVLPVLTRGATEAAAWYGGACAARLYERPSFDFPPPAGADDRFRVTAARVLRAGCFATALLIGVAQLQLALAYGSSPPRLGDDPATDAVLLRTLDDLLRDVATEAATLLAWRLARTNLSRLD